MSDVQPLPSGARTPELRLDEEMLDRLCKTTASFENIINQAITALKLREQKTRTGAYPDPATFKTPTDVFIGEPMSYVRSGDGFTLRVSTSPPNGGPEEQVWEW
ncbi:MAG: hypothetical protein IT430_11005 [Phycisphaerales bacterium]|nr:hypothetical protein [Phycisphaerales bacterium]